MEQRVSRASPQSESLLSKLLIQQRANLSSDQCGHESAVEEQMCVLSAYHDSIKAWNQLFKQFNADVAKSKLFIAITHEMS